MTNASVLVQNFSNENEKAVLLELKEFKRGALFRPSDEVFTHVQNVEQLFRVKTSDSLMESSNAVAQLEQDAMLLHSNLPSCHDLKKKNHLHIHQAEVNNCIKVYQGGEEGKK